MLYAWSHMMKMGLHRHMLVEISCPQHLKLLHPSFVSHHWKRSEQWVNRESNEGESMSLLQLSDNELLEMQLIDDFVFCMFLKGWKNPNLSVCKVFALSNKKKFPK